MSILDSALSLDEMERALGNAILKKKGKIRTIGDLGLTTEEYKLLAFHFRGFKKYQGDIKAYERYVLCLLTYGAYIIKSEPDNKKATEIIQTAADQIPQYMQRKILEVFDNAIKDYALSNPSIHLNTISQLIQVFLMYSYDNESVYEKYFSEIDKYDEVYTEEFFEELNKKVFVREQELYDEMTREKVFGMCRDAYFDCLKNGLNEDEMLAKYPRLNYLFVKTCCKWCSERQEKLRMKFVQ